MKTNKALILLTCGFGLCANVSQAQAPAAYETAVVLNASNLLPADLLRGTSYRVRDQVVTDGFLAHFQIDTDFGTFEAIGVPQVRRRIVEAEAIRKLVETSKSDLFAEGLKRSITQPIDAVKNIVTHPVDSVKQAPKTVGHFFIKVGGTIERGVNKVKERNDAEGDPSAGEIGSGIGNAAKTAAQRVIVFCHYPLIPAGNPHNLWNAEELVALFAKHKHIAAYLNGHNHAGNYGTHGNCHYVNLKGMVETEKETAYAVVKCFPDRLEIEGYGLEPDRKLEEL